MSKRCPYCRHLMELEYLVKGGYCDACGKKYRVKYCLSKIKMMKDEPVRNYDTDVLKFLHEKGEAYIAQISAQARIERSTVRAVLKRLEDSGLLSKERRRGKVFYTLTDSGLVALFPQLPPES